jgi:hypothetical protein
MEDGYTTPVEQITNNLTLTCPNAPLRKTIRPVFQEPSTEGRRLALALAMTTPTDRRFGGLTLKGYGSDSSKNQKK